MREDGNYIIHVSFLQILQFYVKEKYIVFKIKLYIYLLKLLTFFSIYYFGIA